MADVDQGQAAESKPDDPASDALSDLETDPVPPEAGSANPTPTASQDSPAPPGQASSSSSGLSSGSSSGKGESDLFSLSGLIGIGLLALFFVAVGVGLHESLQAPRVADDARVAQEFGSCTANARGAPSAAAPSGQARNGTAGKKAKQKGRPSNKAVQSRKKPVCPAGYHLVLGQQLRGGFDPAARVTSLIAIVAPLITTIVAFFWGAKAGKGQAADQVIQAHRETASAKTETATVRSVLKSGHPAIYNQLVNDEIIPRSGS